MQYDHNFKKMHDIKETWKFLNKMLIVFLGRKSNFSKF